MVRGWGSAGVRGSYSTGLWTEIRHEWELLFTDAVLLVGDGRRISFSEDIWCAGEALATAFLHYLTWLFIKTGEWLMSRITQMR